MIGIEVDNHSGRAIAVKAFPSPNVKFPAYPWPQC